MLKEGESVLGLDITHKGIKIVELKKTPQGIELAMADTIPLLSEATKEESSFIEPKFVAPVLTEFLQNRGISAKKAVFLVNPPHTVTRLIRLPFISQDDMRATLENEVNQYADFKNRDKVIDFCSIEEISEEGIKKVNVLFAAVLKKTVDYITALAGIANLELLGIDSGNLCIIRALNNVNLKTDSLEPVMLIIINASDIQMCVLKGSRLRFVHAIKIDIEKLASAEREDFINKLAIAIRLALNYYEMSGLGGESVFKIIVNPNAALAKDLDKELGDRLRGQSVERANPLGRLHIDSNKFSTETLEDINLNYAQVIGAALKTEDAPGYPLTLNLLPSGKEKSFITSKELPLYASALGVLLVLYLLIWGIFYTNILFTQNNLVNVTKQLQKADASMGKIIPALSVKNISEDKIKEGDLLISKMISGSRPIYSQLIAEILTATPNELWLSVVSSNIKGGIINLEGSALLEKAVFDYVNMLANNKKYFNTAELLSSQTEGETLRFMIRCQLKK